MRNFETKRSAKSRWGNLIALLLCYSFAGGGIAAAQSSKNSDASSSASLKKYLQTLGDDKQARYVAAFEDLDGDGTPEAIVYMLGGEWCGSGGCDTIILQQKGESWKTVTDISITQPPVRVLRSSSKGWRNLAVSVGGGGIPVGYEAELRFDGKSYPDNPTTPPAKRLKDDKAPGKTVILSLDHAVPLHP
ncbi:hypothetical protein [Methylocystis parvus]|uniref:hypothetical protein n=1 Tax=Methylocystis parvus TaxID=134 RepID=UPI003C714557